jgi:hypothetical protein
MKKSKEKAAQEKIINQVPSQATQIKLSLK